MEPGPFRGKRSGALKQLDNRAEFLMDLSS